MWKHETLAAQAARCMPDAIVELARRFAAYDRDAEDIVDASSPDVIDALVQRLERVGDVDAAARARFQPTSGTFLGGDGPRGQGPAQWITVDRSGVRWDGQDDPTQGGTLARWTLAEFVASDAERLRREGRLADAMIDRAVEKARALVVEQALAVRMADRTLRVLDVVLRDGRGSAYFVTGGDPALLHASLTSPDRGRFVIGDVTPCTFAPGREPIAAATAEDAIERHARARRGDSLTDVRVRLRTTLAGHTLFLVDLRYDFPNVNWEEERWTDLAVLVAVEHGQARVVGEWENAG